MVACVDDLMQLDCPDMSVCGNDCTVEDGDPVSMDRCDDDEFRVCDLAIAPRALTAVAFPPEVTYLRVETCVLTTTATACLQDPLPTEIYGATVVYGSGDGATSLSHWPSSLDVEYSVAALCEQDSHCPGSFCSSQQQPRVCAPKMGEHFRESGEHFLDPRWEILGQAT
ncbi:unnamed protein product [Scytosiphon promiscuus]